MLFSAWELCGPCENPLRSDGPGVLPCRVDRPTVKKASIEYREDRSSSRNLGHEPGRDLFWDFSSERSPAKLLTCV
jgi:hypothetical protein